MEQQIYIIEDNHISVDPKLKYYGSIDTRIVHIDAEKLNSKNDSVGKYINILSYSH